MAEIWIRIISIWCPACGLLLLGITKRNSSRMREREVEAHGTKKGKHCLKPCFSLIFFRPFFICFRGCESNSAWKKPYAWPAPSVWQLPKRAMQCWLFHIASHSQNFIFHFQSQSRIELQWQLKPLRSALLQQTRVCMGREREEKAARSGYPPLSGRMLWTNSQQLRSAWAK